MRSIAVFIRIAFSPLRLLIIWVNISLWASEPAGLRYGIGRKEMVAALGAGVPPAPEALAALWWTNAFVAAAVGLWMRGAIAKRVSGERAWIVPGLREKQLILALVVGVAYAVAVFFIAEVVGKPLALAFAAMAMLVFVGMLAGPSFTGGTREAKIACIGVLLAALVFPETSLALVQHSTFVSVITFVASAGFMVGILFDRETERFMTLGHVESDRTPDLSWTEDEAEPTKRPPTAGELLRPVGALGRERRTWRETLKASWALAWQNGEGQALSVKGAVVIAALSILGLAWVRRWGSIDLIIYMVVQVNVIAWVPFEHRGVAALPRELRMRIARNAALIRIWTFTIVTAAVLCAVRAFVPGLEWTKLEDHVDVITPLTFGCTAAALAPALIGLRPILAFVVGRITAIDQPPPVFSTYAAGLLLGALGLGLGADLHQFLKPLPLWQSTSLFVLITVASHTVFHLALRIYYSRTDLVPAVA